MLRGSRTTIRELDQIYLFAIWQSNNKEEGDEVGCAMVAEESDSRPGRHVTPWLRPAVTSRQFTGYVMMVPTIKPSATIPQNTAVAGFGGNQTMLGVTNLVTRTIPTISLIIEKNSARPPCQIAAA